MLYNKYTVTKNEGDTDPQAQYFVLRVDTDRCAQLSVLHYALLIENEQPEFAEQLRDWVMMYWEKKDVG